MIAALIIIAAAAAADRTFSHIGRHRKRCLLQRTGSASDSGKIDRRLTLRKPSEEKANAYFADGIQDEILTRLSKIADLKVISRTSTQHYKSAPENLPEIAKQLGDRAHFGRQRAEERRHRAGERSTDQSRQCFPSLVRYL
jgi:hypothetical protein